MRIRAVVEYKNGQVSKFGTTSASRHSASGRSETLSWAIRETQDQSGNTITYDYVDQGDGEHLISVINYTGNNGADGDRHVRFIYEDRAKHRTYFMAGGKTRSTQRLKTIRTEYVSTKIREYTLDYGAQSASTGRSLLRSVTECAFENGVTAHCLPATDFEWQEQAVQFEMEKLQFHNGTDWQVVHDDKRWLHDVVPHGDMNGDGVKDWTDFTINAEGQGSSTSDNYVANCYRPINSHYLICLEADFDADGKTDGVKKLNEKLFIRLSSDPLQQWFDSTLDWKNGTSEATADSPLGFADFNGDGWIDLAIRQTDKLYIYFHTGVGTNPYFNASSEELMTFSQVPGGGSYSKTAQIYGIWTAMALRTSSSRALWTRTNRKVCRSRNRSS